MLSQKWFLLEKQAVFLTSQAMYKTVYIRWETYEFE